MIQEPEKKQEDIIQVSEFNDIRTFKTIERASIEMQIDIARKYPRDLRKVIEDCIIIACIDKETAASCRYAKPVGRKNVTGASVHLARIIGQQFGNFHMMKRVKNVSEKLVTVEVLAIDLEKNYTAQVEVSRSIVGRTGRRYSDSAIETNSMAIMAIAERNAILNVVPKPITDKVFKEAFSFAFSDLMDPSVMVSERDRILKLFLDEYAIVENDLLRFFGLRSKEDAQAEDVADLRGYLQALKDKEISVRDLSSKKEAPKKPMVDRKKDLKKKQNKAKIVMP